MWKASHTPGWGDNSHVLSQCFDARKGPAKPSMAVIIALFPVVHLILPGGLVETRTIFISSVWALLHPQMHWQDLSKTKLKIHQVIYENVTFSGFLLMTKNQVSIKSSYLSPRPQVLIECTNWLKFVSSVGVLRAMTWYNSAVSVI